MATINELTSEQIRNPEVYQKIKDFGDAFVRCVQAKETYFLQEKLESILKASDIITSQPELYKKYQDLITQLKWTALLMLSDEEVLKLLKENYLSVLNNEDIDVQNSIEAKMYTKGLFPRNELRQKMQTALKENKERLGERTFGEWLLDYSRTFDFRERDELTPSKYTSQNVEAQTLSEPEKNKLRKALQIFDKILLVTPVISEPLFSMAVRKMIKAGIIKERVNPTLLQPPIRTATSPKKTPVEEKPTSLRPASLRGEPVTSKVKKPSPFEKLLRKPIPPKTEKTPEEITSYEKRISPYERKRETNSAKEEEGYQIRTMKQDIASLDARQEKAKKQPLPTGKQAIPPKSKVRDNNIVDLSKK